jgi:hypothetical protein
MAKQTLFKVVSISQNTNSFGLYGVIIADKTGLSFEIGVSYINLPVKGNIVTGQVTDSGNLHSLPFSYEIPRKLPTVPKDVLRELFPEVKKHVNLAKGKKIKTTYDFAKVYDKLNVDNKAKVINNIKDTLAKGVSPRGTKILESERKATEQLLAWCGVNLMVGNELCPPENLNQY